MRLAILAMVHQRDQHFDYPKNGEVPFDTNRKRMSTMHNTPAGNMRLYLSANSANADY